VRVVSYLRVSHDLQADNYTFETQEKRVREKLDSHYGPNTYDLTIYKDDGLSGGFGPVATGIQKRTRPTLRKLEQEIKGGCYDCLAVYNSSRLFRSARWFLQWLDDVFIPSGIEFLSATELLDISSSQGRAMLGVLAVINTSYREDCQQRNRDALASRVEDGYTLGYPPYGWQFESRNGEYAGRRRGIIPDLEAGVHLRMMRDRYLAGAGGQKIAAELNDLSIASPGGRQWSSTMVVRTLTNPIHTGFVVTKRQGMKQGRHFDHRYWEPSDYEEIIELCRRRRTHWKTGTAKSGLSDLVGGIALCAQCGKRLFSTGGKYRGYICRSGRAQGRATCAQVTAHGDVLEGAVIEELKHLAQNPAMRQLLLEEAAQVTDKEDEALEQEQVQINRSLENLKGQSSRLLDCLGRDVIAEADFVAANSQINGDRDRLQKRLAEIETCMGQRAHRESWAKKVKEMVLNFPLLWENATFDEQRQIMLSLVEHLTLDRDGRDALIRIKIHLMPEREFRVSFDHTKHLKFKPKGVAALTPRHLALLHYVGQNKSPKEIADSMGTGINCIYQFSMSIRRTLGVATLQEAYQVAQPHIEQQLPFLPLGSSGKCTLRTPQVTVLADTLKEVLPFLAQGATSREVARRTGLTANAVLQRRKRILEIFEATTMFQAAERARALGFLST
jgi:site-specific DNA recombinase